MNCHSVAEKVHHMETQLHCNYWAKIALLYKKERERKKRTHKVYLVHEEGQEFAHSLFSFSACRLVNPNGILTVPW